MTTLVEAIGHARHCPTVCLTADKATAWFAARIEALAADWERGLELDALSPTEAEPFHRLISHLRALLDDA